MIQERVSFIEVGRIASIFFVVLLHACLGSYYLFVAQHDINWYMTLAYYTFSRVSVPVFVMISGVTTIWLKYEAKKTVSIHDALNRIKKIIIPIVLWSLFYLLLLNQFTADSVLKILWSPQGLVHLWFLYMLIGLYLFSPVVSLVFNTANKNLVRYLLVIWFIFSSVNVYFSPLYNGNLGDWFGLFTNYQSGFLGYYVLGAYMMLRPALSLRYSLLMILAGFAISYILVVWDNYGSASFNDRYLNFLSPNVAIMSYGFISLLRRMDFSKVVLSYIYYASPLVIGVYLTHEMILKFLREHFGLVGYGYNAIWFIPVLATVTVLMSILLSFILSKLQGRYKIFF
ncbi:acyltransferase [Cronobacter dublinensis]|uniref:acyltransferase n=1 Tax=Cronobacter dublinensis TaxID=413497 RepID=UPI003AEBC8B2